MKSSMKAFRDIDRLLNGNIQLDQEQTYIRERLSTNQAMFT